MLECERREQRSTGALEETVDSQRIPSLEVYEGNLRSKFF